jgi:hypothetical protein
VDGKHERKKPLERPKCRRDDNTRIVKVKLSSYRPGQTLGGSWRLRLQDF